MRFAVISDVQGDLPGLQAVMAELETKYQRIERIVSAGDVVGRGPFPNEVLDTLRAAAVDSVLGNYDDAVAFDRVGSGMDFATEAEERADAAALAWTRNALTEENREYLRSLPLTIRLLRSGLGVKVERNVGDERTREYQRTYFLRALFGGLARTPASPTKRVLIVHGSPRALNEFVRPDTAVSILAAIAKDAQTDILVSGHAGAPFVRQAGGVTFIGVGRVHPRADASGRAEYAVVDVTDEIDVDFGSVEYDDSAYVDAERMRGLQTRQPR